MTFLFLTESSLQMWTSVSLFPESVVFWRSSVFSRTAESLAYAMLTMIRVPPSPQILYYDYSCLEMMLISSDSAFTPFFHTYYRGKAGFAEIRLKLLQELKWLSCYRKLNSIFGWAICFNGLSMKKAFETETQNINTAKIISQIRELNPSLTEHIRRQVDQVHIEYDKKHDLPELLSITQGHDFLDYFRELCSTTWPKCGKFPSSRELSRALVTSFRQDDFKRTVLYQQLDSYQNAYHLKILPA